MRAMRASLLPLAARLNNGSPFLSIILIKLQQPLLPRGKKMMKKIPPTAAGAKLDRCGGPDMIRAIKFLVGERKESREKRRDMSIIEEIVRGVGGMG
jgi:hypothetical protein